MKVLELRNCKDKAIFLVGLLWIIMVIPVEGQNWMKKFERIDNLHQKGNYKLANELNHNLQIDIKADLGPQSAYAAIARFKDARNFGAAGYIKEYRRTVHQGLGIARGGSGKSKVDYARLALRGIDILLRNGDYGVADSLLKDLDAINAQLGEFDSHFNNTKKYLWARLHTANGDYEKAANEYNDVESFFLDDTRRKEENEYFLSNKIGHVWTLSSFRIEELERTYAELLTHMARNYGLNGQLDKAETTFSSAGTWIENKLGKSDVSYVENAYQQLLILRKNEEPTQQITALENLIRSFEGKVDRNHQLVLKMKYDLLERYVKNDQIKKYTSLKKELQEINEKYYDKKNIHPDMLTLITWKEPHDNWAISYRISGMQKILIASQAIPENHWSRVKVLESLKQISEDAGYEQETKAYEMQIQAINENIYGKKAHSDSIVVEE